MSGHVLRPVAGEASWGGGRRPRLGRRAGGSRRKRAEQRAPPRACPREEPAVLSSLKGRMGRQRRGKRGGADSAGLAGPEGGGLLRWRPLGEQRPPREAAPRQRGDRAARHGGPGRAVRAPGARAGCALRPEAAGPRLRPRLVVFKARPGPGRAGVRREPRAGGSPGSRAGGRGPRSHGGPGRRPRDPETPSGTGATAAAVSARAPG